MATMPSTSSGTQEQMLVVCETNKESADSEDTSDSGINIYISWIVQAVHWRVTGTCLKVPKKKIFRKLMNLKI